MATRRFFTPEMGKRLRSLRIRARLTQDEAADRMGLTGNRRGTQVWRLEQGRTVNPTLERIALYLRACGARWNEFCDLLEHVDMHAVSTSTFDGSELSEADRDRLADATARQVLHYEQGLRFTSGVKPIHPEHQARAAARLRRYRIAANIIEQAVEEELKQTDLPTVSYPLYKAVARQALGMLWKKSTRRREEKGKGRKGEKGGEKGKGRKGEEGKGGRGEKGKGGRGEKGKGGRGEKGGEKGKEEGEWLAAKLAEKEAGWRAQRLDMELVARVQARVLSTFRTLPDLGGSDSD